MGLERRTARERIQSKAEPYPKRSVYPCSRKPVKPLLISPLSWEIKKHMPQRLRDGHPHEELSKTRTDETLTRLRVEASAMRATGQDGVGGRDGHPIQQSEGYLPVRTTVHPAKKLAIQPIREQVMALSSVPKWVLIHHTSGQGFI